MITAQHVVMCTTTQIAEMLVPQHLLPDDVNTDVATTDLVRFNW
jgi:hypothetical protein